METINGDPVNSVIRDRQFLFRFQCLNTVMMYPEVLDEHELFTVPKRLRNYSITLNNIRGTQIGAQTNIVFGLLQEDRRSEYVVAWSIPLANVLFGPSTFSVKCCATAEKNAKYQLFFTNRSSRMSDYYMIIHSIQLANVDDGSYSLL